MCRERDSNPHSHHWPRDFKSLVSTNSTITAKSGKRDSDPRPQPWQGCALPTELFPLEIKLKIPKDADSSPSYFAPAKLILINETTKQNNIFFIFGMVLALHRDAQPCTATTFIYQNFTTLKRLTIGLCIDTKKVRGVVQVRRSVN